jgi:flagellum-specific ATP synthase
VVLDRARAVSGHFPSVDPLRSISRLASTVTTAEQKALATALRSVLAARERTQDLIDVGAYQPGANALVDAAVAHEQAITAFLQQRMDERSTAAETWSRLSAIVRSFEGVR